MLIQLVSLIAGDSHMLTKRSQIALIRGMMMMVGWLLRYYKNKTCSHTVCKLRIKSVKIKRINKKKRANLDSYFYFSGIFTVLR